MGKMIAIWGSPNSGKSTLSAKIAVHLSEKYSKIVLVLSSDNTVPAIPVLFPGFKLEPPCSLGVILSKTEITQDEILKNIIVTKENPNIGFIGYMFGENSLSYPSFDNKKIISLMKALSELCDYLIIDCTSALQNLITITALETADNIIRTATPSPKTFSFFASQLPFLADPIFRLGEHITVLNNTENDIFMPVTESARLLGYSYFNVAYSKLVKFQGLSGQLFKRVNGKSYNAAIKKLAERVVQDDTRY